MATTKLEDFVQAGHPDPSQVNHSTIDDHGVIAPTNDSIHQINENVFDMLPGQAQHEKSSDRLDTDDSENMPKVVFVEYFNSQSYWHPHVTCESVGHDYQKQYVSQWARYRQEGTRTKSACKARTC